MLDARFIMNISARRQAGEHVLNVIRPWYCHNGFTPLLVYCLFKLLHSQSKLPLINTILGHCRFVSNEYEYITKYDNHIHNLHAFSIRLGILSDKSSIWSIGS